MPGTDGGGAVVRAPLSRERIVGVAIELVDRGGLESLTMRTLGRELGVEAMSLYNHVENKDDLLDGMLDTVVGEIDLPDAGADWKEAIRVRAISAHDVFARHSWASVLIDSRRSASAVRFRYYDAVIGSLRQGGFSLELTAHAFSILDSYIKGFALQETSMSFERDRDLAETAEMLLQAIATDYPYLAELTEHTLSAGHSYQAQFEFGLDLILDALDRARIPDAGG